MYLSKVNDIVLRLHYSDTESSWSWVYRTAKCDRCKPCCHGLCLPQTHASARIQTICCKFSDVQVNVLLLIICYFMLVFMATDNNYELSDNSTFSQKPSLYFFRSMGEIGELSLGLWWLTCILKVLLDFIILWIKWSLVWTIMDTIFLSLCLSFEIVFDWNIMFCCGDHNSGFLELPFSNWNPTRLWTLELITFQCSGWRQILQTLVGSVFPSLVYTTEKEKGFMHPISKFGQRMYQKFAYFHVQSVLPDSYGYGMVDSPVGLIGWIGNLQQWFFPNVSIVFKFFEWYFEVKKLPNLYIFWILSNLNPCQDPYMLWLAVQRIQLKMLWQTWKLE